MSKSRKQGTCAYCGTTGLVTTDHVVPKSLFPSSTRSKCKFVFADACDPCNQGFSKHESDFRSFCTLASKEPPEAKELFYGPIKRALDDEMYGEAARRRILAKMQPSSQLPGRFNIYPDDGVRLILRKIIRGLAFKHSATVLSDSAVNVQVLDYPIPNDMNRHEDFHAIHPAVFRYRFFEWDDSQENGLHSTWMLKFFETVQFIAWVSRTKGESTKRQSL